MTKSQTAKRETVATRNLLHITESVRISVFRPVEIAKEEWKCEFEVSGLEIEPPTYAIGIDGLQALTIALEAIRIKLEPYMDNLSWEYCGEVGRIGMPYYVPSHLGAAFEQRVRDMISVEMTRIVESARESKKN